MGFSYSTSVVARLAGVTSETLRGWMREGRLDEPPRNGRNHRVFGFEHVSRVMDLAGLSARRVISVVNQKGGVGKTTTVFNLAGCLAYRGRRVLAVDLDAQANLTTSFGVDPDTIPLSSEDLLTNDAIGLDQVVRATEFEGLDLVPADIRLAGADTKLREMIMREKILAGKIAPALKVYDFVIFDCPPNLSTITINALVASTDAIIPMETQCYSIKAFHDLSRTLNVLKTRMGHDVRIWVLPTKIDRRITMSNQLLESMQKSLDGRILPAVRTDASVMKAPMIQEPVIFSFPRSRAAADYHAVSREVLETEPSPPA
jgi:chromosome partitioning protein